MKNEKVVRALDSVAPDEDAKRRMFENIEKQAGLASSAVASSDEAPSGKSPKTFTPASVPAATGNAKAYDSSAFTPIPDDAFEEVSFGEPLPMPEDLPDLPHAPVSEPLTYRHEERKQQMSRPWAIGIGVAACLVLAVGVGALTIPHFLGASSSASKNMSASSEASSAVTGNAAESATSGEDTSVALDQGTTAGPDQTYSALSWNGITYSAGLESSDQSNAARLDPTEVGDSLGNSTAAAEDGSTETVEVFAMTGVDSSVAVAVRFPSDSAYYLYTAPASEVS